MTTIQIAKWNNEHPAPINISSLLSKLLKNSQSIIEAIKNTAAGKKRILSTTEYAKSENNRIIVVPNNTDQRLQPFITNLYDIDIIEP